MKLPIATFALAMLCTPAVAQQDNDFPPDPIAVEAMAVAPRSERAPATRKSLVNFTLKGRVAAIEDGDTITLRGVKNRFIIRFSDMDTPETAHDAFTPRTCKCNPLPYRPGQPGGIAAHKSLLELLTINDSVRAECYELDLYGRSVCHVFKGNTNINLQQIRRGWGWLATKEAWIRDPNSAQAEEEAKRNKRGAWGLTNQVHPDVWRRECWGEPKNCPNQEPKP